MLLSSQHNLRSFVTISVSFSFFFTCFLTPAQLSFKPLSDSACWLRTHSYLQEQPWGVVAKREKRSDSFTRSPGRLYCLPLSGFIGAVVVPCTYHFLLYSILPSYILLSISLLSHLSRVVTHQESGFRICQSAVCFLFNLSYICERFVPSPTLIIVNNWLCLWVTP